MRLSLSIVSPLFQVLALALVWGMTGDWAAASTLDDGEGRPNVVVLYVDDLGWSDLGCYGSRRHDTPVIDSLAKQGLRFTAAYANAPNCAPARACLLTGQYGPRHGVYTVRSSFRGNLAHLKVIPVASTPNLPESSTTLPEVLSAAGYECVTLGKWHLGPDPLKHGFGRNIGGTHRGSPPVGYTSPYEIETLADGPEGEYLTERITDEALAVLGEDRDGPLFLLLSYFTVHKPIEGKRELVAQYAEDLDEAGANYAAMVRSLDESVGRLLKGLEELGMRENTLLLFLSDNGGHMSYTEPGPLRGAKGMLYEGGIRVPMIASWPGRIPAEGPCDEPVMAVDLFPTILELAGIAPPADSVLDGVSLAGLLSGKEPPEREAIFWHFPVYVRGDAKAGQRWRSTPVGVVRSGRYKLFEFFEDGALELYDLASDPGESVDLSEQEPEITARLHALMKAWREDTGAPLPSGPNPLYDPDAR